MSLSPEYKRMMGGDPLELGKNFLDNWGLSDPPEENAESVRQYNWLAAEDKVVWVYGDQGVMDWQLKAACDGARLLIRNLNLGIRVEQRSYVAEIPTILVYGREVVDNSSAQKKLKDEDIRLKTQPHLDMVLTSNPIKGLDGCTDHLGVIIMSVSGMSPERNDVDYDRVIRLTKHEFGHDFVPNNHDGNPTCLMN